MSTTTKIPTQAQAHAALPEGAAIQQRSDAGVIALTDTDRVDFLQRMTTNDIQALRPGTSCITVLTSPTAKIIQVFTVLARAEDLLLLPARGETVASSRHLRGQIFFMDKVKVTDLRSQYARMRLMGPAASAALKAIGFAATGVADGDWHEFEGVLAVAEYRYDVPGFELVVPVDKQVALVSDLTTAGVVVLNDDTAYTARRVELGRPASGAELVGEYSPLEAGLGWACAENKGCYTGQEIIARQVTYDKITRSLIGLHSDGLLIPGDAITAEGREVGIVTSAAYSAALDAYLALAIVKRPYTAPDTAVVVSGQAARVANLPFVA